MPLLFSSSSFFCLFICFYLYERFDCFRVFPLFLSLALIVVVFLDGMKYQIFRNPLHYVRVYFYVAVVHSNQAFAFFNATFVSIHSLIHRNDWKNNQTRQGWARFERKCYLLYVRCVCVCVCLCAIDAIFVEQNFNFRFVTIVIANLFELISLAACAQCIYRILMINSLKV